MNFRQYVERQKAILKNSHSGEECLLINGEVIPLRPADEILGELENLNGVLGGARTQRYEQSGRGEQFGQSDGFEDYSRSSGYAV